MNIQIKTLQHNTRKNLWTLPQKLMVLIGILSVTCLIKWYLIATKSETILTKTNQNSQKHNFNSESNCEIMENCDKFEFVDVRENDAKNFYKYRIKSLSNDIDDKYLTYQDVMQMMKLNANFRKQFFGILRFGLGRPKEKSFAYFFEVRPVTKYIYSTTPFEFVLLPAPSLDGIIADPSDFQEHFDSCDKDVATFSNLGGDAHLVVPCPPTENHSASNDQQNYQNIYGHLAAFMKFNQNLDQIHNFWIQVAKAFEEQIQKRREDSPLWLSTCGTGVYWLHVRLDSRPKYYSFQEYRKFH